MAIIEPDSVVRADNYINLAEKNATPANDAGRVVKLESDGKIDPFFLRTPANPIVRTYTGNATWTKPAGLKYIIVEVQGGGGGGQGGFGGSGGTAGGTSSFGSHCSATGGAGGANEYSDNGVGSGGDINWEGQQGVHTYDGTGMGGASYFGKSGGRGGTPNAGTSGDQGACGGGGAGYSRKLIAVATLGANETVTVGAGGNGGNGGGGYGSTGEAGKGGIVVVTEFY